MPAGRVVAPGSARIVEDALAQLGELRQQRSDGARGFACGDLAAGSPCFAEARRQLEGEAELRHERRLDIRNLTRDARARRLPGPRVRQ
jgi:hypothetical protein